MDGHEIWIFISELLLTRQWDICSLSAEKYIINLSLGSGLKMRVFGELFILLARLYNEVQKMALYPKYGWDGHVDIWAHVGIGRVAVRACWLTRLIHAVSGMTGLVAWTRGVTEPCDWGRSAVLTNKVAVCHRQAFTRWIMIPFCWAQPGWHYYPCGCDTCHHWWRLSHHIGIFIPRWDLGL